eukprot:GFUD01044158.1.p1 GENE.GFUD01044158.1~~GFUD01044158.1.p1  ORF type:complete len:227 (-),score=57.12 GFUD01044158.1:130-744(-)
MPYRCQKCLNTFKTLPLYNKHATGPAGTCNVKQVVVAKPVTAPVTLKREAAVEDPRSRSERKKVRSYREADGDSVDKADQILAEALGDDSDCDPDYNPRGDKEDDDDIDLGVNKKKLNSFTPTVASTTKSYTRITTFPKETFPCRKCNKKFETKTKMNEHVNEEHEDQTCVECEDDFFWPDASHECYYAKYKLRMLAGDIVPAF